jgi:Zn-dependent protease with chaperone function
MSNVKIILSYILFAALTAIIPGLLVAHWIAYAAGAAVIIAWWIIASVAGDRILLGTLKAQPLNIVIYPEIGKIVATRIPAARNGLPTLWTINSLAPMILSIGLIPRHSHLVLSKGLLDKQDDKVKLSLVVRELESIRSGQTSANTGAATLLWLILSPGRIANRAMGKDPGDPNGVATFLNLIPAFLAALFLAMMADKKAVYKIDRTAQKLLENSDYLPYAFMKFHEASLAVAFNVDLALAPCCIANPNSHDAFAGLFKPYPPIPKRIERMRPRSAPKRMIR